METVHASVEMRHVETARRCRVPRTRDGGSSSKYGGEPMTAESIPSHPMRRERQEMKRGN